jgi:transglutaminase-like putative cysteine protease
MHIKARHVTRYRYSQPVWCEPLTVRLRPRNDFRQRLLSFGLEVDPPPAGINETMDLEGNTAATVWFSEAAETLALTTAFEAVTEDVNPFQFVLHPSATRLPLTPTAEEHPHFALYASQREHSPEVVKTAHDLARQANLDTLEFLCSLNEWIHARHEKILRPDGAAWAPEQTMREGRGACRDLAVLFMAVCRVFNIPSRFVSGYGLTFEESKDHELHAWAEVYLPGAGWRAFDPSLGLAITERHLSVAVGVTPELAAPVSGTFRGDATSQLQVEMDIEVFADQTI